jgi:membrane protein/epoxyqueuosine reductase
MPVIHLENSSSQTPLAEVSATIPAALVPPESRMKFYVRGAWLFFKRMWPAIYDLSSAETHIFASAIAFNAALSFFSFLVMTGSLLVYVFAWQEGYEMMYRLMRAFAPTESAPMIVALDKVTRGMGAHAGWFSMLMLIFSSTGAFMPLEVALNRAWGFKSPRGSIKRRLIYPLVVMGCAVVILGLTALASGLNRALHFLFASPTVESVIFSIASLIIGLPCIALVFFLIYYWVPGGKVLGSQIFFASAAMAILWVIVTFVYQMLLPNLQYRNRYGGLFTVVTICMWIFISAYILILGANLSAREILPRAWTGDLPLGLTLRLDELPGNIIEFATDIIEGDESTPPVSERAN